jgi:hypothetical protein
MIFFRRLLNWLSRTRLFQWLSRKLSRQNQNQSQPEIPQLKIPLEQIELGTATMGVPVNRWAHKEMRRQERRNPEIRKSEEVPVKLTDSQRNVFAQQIRAQINQELIQKEKERIFAIMNEYEGQIQDFNRLNRDDLANKLEKERDDKIKRENLFNALISTVEYTNNLSPEELEEIEKARLEDEKKNEEELQIRLESQKEEREKFWKQRDERIERERVKNEPENNLKSQDNIKRAQNFTQALKNLKQDDKKVEFLGQLDYLASLSDDDTAFIKQQLNSTVQLWKRVKNKDFDYTRYETLESHYLDLFRSLNSCFFRKHIMCNSSQEDVKIYNNIYNLNALYDKDATIEQAREISKAKAFYQNLDSCLRDFEMSKGRRLLSEALLEHIDAIIAGCKLFKQKCSEIDGSSFDSLDVSQLPNPKELKLMDDDIDDKLTKSMGLVRNTKGKLENKIGGV